MGVGFELETIATDVIFGKIGSCNLATLYECTHPTCLPLLASDIAGAREVVDDGKIGFLFPVGDITAIADLIVKVATDPDLRHRIGTNARTYVERNHRLDVAVGLLRGVLADLVCGGCPSRLPHTGH